MQFTSIFVTTFLALSVFGFVSDKKEAVKEKAQETIEAVKDYTQEEKENIQRGFESQLEKIKNPMAELNKKLENGEKGSNPPAYPNATIRNRTKYRALVQVNYPGCRNDEFYVPAATFIKGETIEGFATAPTDRGGCLITWIAVTLEGWPGAVQRYESSGTGYSQFVIQSAESGYRIWSNQEIAAENAKKGEGIGKSPGFYITNKTIWPVSVALDQVGCLYYGTLKPGEVFNKDTGAVWFTIKANIQADGKEPRTDWDCVTPVAEIVGAIIVTAATAGAGAFAELPAAAAGTAAAALAPIATSSAVIISGAAVGGALTGALTMTAKQIGELLTSTGKGELTGQYAGFEWPFRCDQKPTYEIKGGWGAPQKLPDGTWSVDKGTPLTIVKTNTCGNSMMQ